MNKWLECPKKQNISLPEITLGGEEKKWVLPLVVLHITQNSNCIELWNLEKYTYNNQFFFWVKIWPHLSKMKNICDCEFCIFTLYLLILEQCASQCGLAIIFAPSLLFVISWMGNGLLFDCHFLHWRFFPGEKMFWSIIHHQLCLDEVEKKTMSLLFYTMTQWLAYHQVINKKTDIPTALVI